jgi:hypothetical protein
MPVPKGVPWSWSSTDPDRIVEEKARHAGHADIIRESTTGPPCTP